jgi:hypothetical protein
MRQSPSTLRRPTVNRNRKPSLSAGLLDELGPQRMIATAKATSRRALEYRRPFRACDSGRAGPRSVHTPRSMHCRGGGKLNITMSGS